MAENHHLARLGPIALLAFVWLAFWKITLSGGTYTWLDSPDLVDQVLPWLQFETTQLHTGSLPLWDPHEGGGESLLGQMQPGPANPVNWLLFAMPLDRGFLNRTFVNAYFILIHYLAALFCYFLCRDLGRGVLASIFGGSIFALGGWIGYTDWPQMLCGGIWAPLVFLFLLRVAANRGPALRNAALSGGFMGLAFLSGHHQIPIFIGLAAAACWFYHLAQDWRSPSRWYTLAAFAAMTLAVGALQILPANEYGRHAVRWVGATHPLTWKEMVPYTVLDRYSLPPVAILSTVMRDLSDNTTAYIGWCALLMAIVGAVVSWRETAGRLLTFVAAGGMLLAMGSETIFHGLLYALVPDFNKARTIGFAVFLFGFGAAVLAARGLDSFLDAPRRIRTIIAWIATIGAAIFLLAPWILSHTKLPRTQDFHITMLRGALALGIAAALWIWHSRRFRAAPVALVALSLGELCTGVGYGYQRTDRPGSFVGQLTQHARIAAWLKAQPAPVRAEIDQTEIPYNFCDWYGIDTLDVLIPSLTTNIEAVRGYYWGRMLLGSNFYIGRNPSRPNQVERFRDSRGVAIYENPDALPRLWTVHRAEIAGPNGMGAALERTGAALRRVAVFDRNPPALDTCAGDSAGPLHRDTNRLAFEVDMKCRGLAIVGEVYDPGWRATMDGHPAPLLEADGVARALIVPAGHHTIQMRYRPPSVIAGAVLTALGLAAMAILAFL